MFETVQVKEEYVQVCEDVAISGRALSKERSMQRCPAPMAASGSNTNVKFAWKQPPNHWHLLLQDYLIAEGYNNATATGKAVHFEAKYYFSQDGAR